MANKLYTVKPGECLSSLAADQGFTDVPAVWDSQPAAIKSAYTSANHLVPGKSVMLPFEEKSLAGKATAAIHSFVKKTMLVKLRIVVIDQKNKPPANLPYNLAHTEILSHSTGRQPLPSNGLIEKEIPANVTSGTLCVYLDRWQAQPELPAPPVAPVPPAAPPPYPPPFQATHFRDKSDTEYIGSMGQSTVQWSLKIGYLSSHKDEAGMTARLENLGFKCGEGVDAAVRAFQAAYGDAVTGYGPANQTSVKDSVMSRHDDPP